MDLCTSWNVSRAAPRRHLIEIAGKYVCTLVVLAEIQAHLVLVFGDAQPHDGFEQKQNYRTPHSYEDDGNSNSNQLSYKQRRISIKQPVVTGGVDCFRCENSSHDGTEDSARAVHTDNIQRI